MTIKELYDEMVRAECENYDIKVTGEYFLDDIGGIEYTIDDNEFTVYLGDKDGDNW